MQRLLNSPLVIQTVIGWALNYYIILLTAAFLLSLINKYKQNISIGYFQETGQIRDSTLLTHNVISSFDIMLYGPSKEATFFYLDHSES